MEETRYNKNGTDIENGLKKSISQLKKGKNANKVILLLSDGQAKYEEDVVKSASDSNIHVYTINVGSEDAGVNLKKICGGNRRRGVWI